MNKKQDNSVGETSKNVNRTNKKEFKVSDMDDWYYFENDNSSDIDTEKMDLKPKNKRGKIKKNDSDEDDNEPLEDSDEGDYDDKEVDYMSDTSSSSCSETEKADIKGVEDESALRDLVVSGDEQENEENENEQEEEIEDSKKNEAETKIKAKNESMIFLFKLN